MASKIFLYAFAIWFVFMAFAILNGTIRNSVYAPVIGKWGGHIVSSIIMIGFIILVTYLFLNNLITGYSTTQLVLVGVLWLSLTVTFEFVFQHYLMGVSWETLLADYNILEGRIWSLVLLTTLIAPYVIGTILNQ